MPEYSAAHTGVPLDDFDSEQHAVYVAEPLLPLRRRPAATNDTITAVPLDDDNFDSELAVRVADAQYTEARAQEYFALTENLILGTGCLVAFGLLVVTVVVLFCFLAYPLPSFMDFLDYISRIWHRRS